jgi:hypothetical protein
LWFNFEKSFNNLSLTVFSMMEVKIQDMNKKIKVLALISLVIAATIAISIVLVTQSIAKADAINSIASDVQPTLSSINETSNTGLFFNGHLGFGEYGGMNRGCRGVGRLGEFGAIQVSSDFTQNVTNIAKNDSDVQNLLSQGFNITSVRPIISSMVDGNGNIITKAAGADLTLQSATGRSLVVVDLSQEKVTKIVTITMTEIDK